jgi:hypothetical protein
MEVGMDGSHVDTLARAIAQRGTRRWLVRLVATLPLGGVLITRGADEAAAFNRYLPAFCASL